MPDVVVATDGLDARSDRVAALHCEICGSREPARTPARLHGWQRCRHCASVILAPWSEWEAFDGPNARTVLLERRGRSHFIVPRRTLMTSAELAGMLLIVHMIAAFGVGFFEIPPTPAGAWRWLGPLLVGLGGLIASALLLRAWATVQHLEISPQRMKSYRGVGAGVHARREWALTGGLEVDVVDGAGTASEKCRVRLRPHGAKPVDLIVPTLREAGWVAVLVQRAAHPGDAPAPRCEGCGAPHSISPSVHAEGSTDCAHCGAGLVVGARSINWGRVEIPWPPELELPPGPQDGAAAQTEWEREAPRPPRPPPGLRVSQRRGARGTETVWELPPDSVLLRGYRALAIALPGFFFAGFGAACLWLVGETPDGTIGLSLYLVCGGVMMFGIAGLSAFIASLELFGRERIVIDEASCWVALSLRSIDLSWLPAVPETGGAGVARAVWRAPRQAVPLLRLQQVKIAREGASTEFQLETPARALHTGWRLPGDADRWLRRELADTLAARLRALGREVDVG